MTRAIASEWYSREQVEQMLNQERKACARICDEMAALIIEESDYWTALGAVEECADSIRDRIIETKLPSVS